MRATVRCVLATALAAAAFPAVAADEDPRVAAFRSVCMPDRRDFDLTVKRVEADGWTAAPSDAHPAQKAVIDSTNGDAGTTGLQSYRKEIDGRADYLIVLRVAYDNVALVGCYLYDFDARAPLGVESFNDWLGDTPAGVVETPNSAFGYRWDEPPNFPGAYEVFAIYLFGGSADAKDAGFSGQVIKITSLEAKKS